MNMFRRVSFPDVGTEDLVSQAINPLQQLIQHNVRNHAPEQVAIYLTFINKATG
jgi:hypothetical protein